MEDEQRAGWTRGERLRGSFQKSTDFTDWGTNWIFVKVDRVCLIPQQLCELKSQTKDLHVHASHAIDAYVLVSHEPPKIYSCLLRVLEKEGQETSGVTGCQHQCQCSSERGGIK